MFNYDCVSFSSSIVNVPYVIILSVSICISSSLVWISINTFKTKNMNLTLQSYWLSMSLLKTLKDSDCAYYMFIFHNYFVLTIPSM